MRTARRRLVSLIAAPTLVLGALVAPAVIGPAPALADAPPAAGWGTNSEGQLGNGLGGYASSPVAVSPGARSASDPYLQVSAGTGDGMSGGGSACGITASGAAYCWGSGTNGKLGNGATAESTTPVAVAAGARSGDDTIASITVGGTYACGLTGAGRAFCWGSNSWGQLGNASQVSSSSPVAVAGGLAFRDLDAGSNTTCGVAMDDSVYCWGANWGGQLGTGSTSGTYTSPTRVFGGALPAGTRMSSVSIAESHACALDVSGAAYCWGTNTYGQLGTGGTSTNYTPVAVTGGLTFAMIRAGSSFTCGLTTANAAYCWGYNADGQLGDGTTTQRTSPQPVDVTGPLGSMTVSLISAGTSNACVRSTAGQLACWGDNSLGQVGAGTVVDAVSPTTVLTGAKPAGTPWADVSVGNQMACGWDASGNAYCWGNRGEGRLGNGTSNRLVSPTWAIAGALPSGQTLTSIEAGNGAACAISSAGGLYCWGIGTFNVLGTGTTASQWAPAAVAQGAAPAGTTYDNVSVGNWHACAVALDDSAYCWGNGGAGQLGTGSLASAATPVLVSTGAKPAGEGWATMGAGGDYTCGLTVPGNLYCWGDNASGNLGTNGGSGTFPTPQLASGGRTYKALAVGFFHSCAIAMDDSTYCWGSNWAGQLGDNTNGQKNIPTLVDRSNMNSGEVFTSLGLGSGHTCGLTNQGRILCWGANNDGELGNGNNTLSRVPVATSAPASGPVTYSAVTANQGNSCGLTPAKAAYCWGSNSSGQLGDGSFTSSNRPVAVTPVSGGPSEFTAISAGNTWVVALAVPPTAPAAPTLISATVTQTSATVSFTAGGDGGAAITNYEYSLDNGAWTALSPADDASPVTINGLSAGTTYSVRLRAVNSVNGGAASSPLAVTTEAAPAPTPPPAPPVVPPGTPLRVAIAPGDASATVTWVPPVELGDPPLVSYRVEASPAGATCTSRTTSCTVVGLVNGTAYSFRVRALSLEQAGEWSTWSAPVVPLGVPSPPTGVIAVAGDDTALVAWQAPADDGGSPITGYVATATPGGATCASASTSCTVSGLVNGTAYTFTVVASSVAGTSPASAASNTVTPRDQVKPSILIVGSRGGRALNERVVVQGTTVGLAGQQAQPWVKLKGQTEFWMRGKPVAVADDGTFRWSGAIRQTARMYFTCGDVESNRIFLPVR